MESLNLQALQRLRAFIINGGSMEITIPWFENYTPSKVGITKQKLKKGTVYRLRYKDPTGYTHRPKGGSCLEEAKRFAHQTHQRLLRQEWNEAEKRQILPFLQECSFEKTEEKEEARLTIREAIAKFQKSVLRGASYHTVKNHTTLYQRIEVLFLHVCSQKTFIDEITTEDIEDILALKKRERFKLRGSWKQPEDITIDDYLRTIRRLFLFLVARKYIADNPALAVKYLCEGGQKSRDVIPEDDEVERIYEALENHSNHHSSNWSPLKEIIHFLVETGARKTEVLTMEWKDIQKDFWIIKEKTCSDGFYFKPKSKKSYRKYFLTDEMQTILENLPRVSPFVFPKAQVRIASKCPSKQNHPSGVAKCCKCPLERDRNQCEFRQIEYSRVQSIDQSWTNIRKKTGTLHLTLHDLRRYNNDKLLEAGLSNAESGVLIGNSEKVNSMHYDVRRNSRLEKAAIEKRNAMGRIAPLVKNKLRNEDSQATQNPLAGR